MVYLIVAIIWGCIWGVATNAVIKNKGYDENWFWWGFFFEIIALLVAATKPENRSNTYGSYDGLSHGEVDSHLTRAADEIRRKDYLNSGGWTCASCKKINPKYLTTCSCGLSKDESQRLIIDKSYAAGMWSCVNCGNENSNSLLRCSCGCIKNSWKCNKCGEINDEYHYVCKCGQKKSENNNIIPASEVNNNTSSKEGNKVEIDIAEAIKKYKELLDMGAISQEEFDKKKKDLL